MPPSDSSKRNVIHGKITEHRLCPLLDSFTEDTLVFMLRSLYEIRDNLLLKKRRRSFYVIASWCIPWQHCSYLSPCRPGHYLCHDDHVAHLRSLRVLAFTGQYLHAKYLILELACRNQSKLSGVPRDIIFAQSYSESRYLYDNYLHTSPFPTESWYTYINAYKHRYWKPQGNAWEIPGKR